MSVKHSIFLCLNVCVSDDVLRCHSSQELSTALLKIGSLTGPELHSSLNRPG